MMTYLLSTVFVVLAEMGDKTQLLAMAFATRYKASTVLRGVFVATLLNHFLAVSAGQLKRPVPALTEEVADLLLHYSYPGNVRELANIVERILVTCPNKEITTQYLPEELHRKSRTATPLAGLISQLPEGGIRFQDVEKELLVKTLEMTKGNKQAAAKILGITRRRLYLRLSDYGLSTTECHQM